MLIKVISFSICEKEKKEKKDKKEKNTIKKQKKVKKQNKEVEKETRSKQDEYTNKLIVIEFNTYCKLMFNITYSLK